MKVQFAVFSISFASLVACTGEASSPPADQGEIATHGKSPSFEEYKAQALNQSAAGPVYFVNGDELVEDEAALRDHWRNIYSSNGALTLNTDGGVDNRLDDVTKKNLTYCIDATFDAAHKTKVVEALRQASDLGWEVYGNVDFRYLSAQDSTCTTSNPNVNFIVTYFPLSTGVRAGAFFPGTPKVSRQLVVYELAFTDPYRPIAATITHELGHILGFRHEHTRQESGSCYEDGNWRAINEYDSASIMAYRECGPTTNTTLSIGDQNGVALLYGPAAGRPAPALPSNKNWGNKTLTADGTYPTDPARMIQLATFRAATGSQFTARINGTGDFDLYVKFGRPPTLTNYDCRPFSPTSIERCTMSSLGDAAYVGVVAKTGGTVSFQAWWTHGQTTTSSLPVSFLGTGARVLTTKSVVPGSPFLATPTYPFDTPNVALYVDFGPAPLVRIDCNFDCRLDVPSGKTSAQLSIFDSNLSKSGGYLNLSWVAPLPELPTCSIMTNRDTGTTADSFNTSFSSNGTSCSLEIDANSASPVSCLSTTPVPLTGLTAGEHWVTLRASNSTSMNRCQKSFTVTSPSSCTLPWGGTIASGSSVTAYQSSSATTCASENRTCTNGVLSGSYTYSTCTSTAPSLTNCPATGSTVDPGVTYECFCSATAIATYTSVWGTDIYTSLSAICAAAVHAGKITAAGGNVSLQGTAGRSSYTGSTRNGVVSRDYGSFSSSISFGTATSPAPLPGSCNLPWGGSVSSGSSVTAYMNKLGTVALSCQSGSQTRTCTNGVLSGSYVNASCKNYPCTYGSGQLMDGTYRFSSSATVTNAAAYICDGSTGSWLLQTKTGPGTGACPWGGQWVEPGACGYSAGVAYKCSSGAWLSGATGCPAAP